MYKYAITLSGYDAKNITEEMAHNSCQIVNASGNSGGVMTAFNGARKATIDAVVADHGIFDWIEKKTNNALGHRGRSYVVLTDNDKYILTVSCFEIENQKTYEVVATDKTLDENKKRDIKNHLLKLGFDLKNWFEPQYDNCYDLNKPPNLQSSVNSTNERLNSQSLPKDPNSSVTNSFYFNVSSVVKDNVLQQNQQQTFPSNVLPVNKGNVQMMSNNYDNVNGASENNSPSPSSNKNKDSIELFFNIFRTAIDFMQNFYKNTLRYILIGVTRIIGRINSTRLST